jgi:hypothetical protein
VTVLLGLMLLLLVGIIVRTIGPASRPRLDMESQIHRCDYCKEAILLIDDGAKTFVLHSEGERPLLGYSVVNACGACVRERRIDAFSQGAEPPS